MKGEMFDTNFVRVIYIVWRSSGLSAKVVVWAWIIPTGNLDEKLDPAYEEMLITDFVHVGFLYITSSIFFFSFHKMSFLYYIHRDHFID